MNKNNAQSSYHRFRNYDNFRKVDLLDGIKPKCIDPHSGEVPPSDMTITEIMSIYDYGYYRAMEQVRISLINEGEQRQLVILETLDVLGRAIANIGEISLNTLNISNTPTEEVSHFVEQLNDALAVARKGLAQLRAELDIPGQSQKFIEESQEACVDSCDSYLDIETPLRKARVNNIEAIKRWPSSVLSD